LERALLFAGLAALGVWAGSKAIPALWQAWENRAFDIAVREAPPPATRTPRLENGHLVGRLSIPRLHLSSMVREGDDEVTLSLALGHIPSTALPGQAGNVGIAGHRDTIFRALQGIRKDDLIHFETLSGTHVYQVDSTHIVKPDDVGVLRPNGISELTLVTCYPFYYVGSAPDRFIVSAHEMAAASVPTSAALVPRTKAALPVATSTRVLARTASFEIQKGHAEQVAPGISLGLTDTDTQNGSVYGWMWITPDHRTILLRDQPAGQPFIFYQGGSRRELLFRGVSENSATGSLSPAE
jgi:sortase A